MQYERVDSDQETTLFVRGELDALTAPDLRTAVDELVDQKKKSIVVDVSDLDLIDSSGVAVLVSLYKRTRAHGGRMVVVGAKDQPLSVFKLLRIDRVFLKEDKQTTSVGEEPVTGS